MTLHHPAAACAAVILLATVGCRDDSQPPTAPVTGSEITPEFAIGSNTWITRADMPSDRNDFATATVPNASGQSILYVMGGRTPAGGSVSQVNAYNVATNTWTWKAPMPVPVFFPNGAGEIGGKIYVSGGALNFSNISTALQVYDPAKNVWTRKHDLPAYGYGGFTGVINGKLYVLTGCIIQQCVFLRYDPATDQWATLPTPTEDYMFGAAGVISNKLYVAGGPFGGLEVYDPVTNRWTIKAPMPQIRDRSASATMGGRLHVIGGLVDGMEVRTQVVYDPVKNIWITKAPLPSTAHGIAVAGKVFLNGLPRIELVGGRRPGNNRQYIQ